MRGSPFALVNGATARGALCIVVQPGVQAPAAVHLLCLSSGGPAEPGPEPACWKMLSQQDPGKPYPAGVMQPRLQAPAAIHLLGLSLRWAS